MLYHTRFADYPFNKKKREVGCGRAEFKCVCKRVNRKGFKVLRKRLSVPRPSRLTWVCHGPARACHAAPLHRAHPWVVGSLWLAWLSTYRARLGDAGAARRDAKAAAHTYKSSGIPLTQCSRDCSINFHPVLNGGLPSWPILTAGGLGSPFDLLKGDRELLRLCAELWPQVPNARFKFRRADPKTCAAEF